MDLCRDPGGGSVWVTGSYDPALNLTYWGVRNAGPEWNRDVRLGDNLYTSSVVALNADTGKLEWYSYRCLWSQPGRSV